MIDEKKFPTLTSILAAKKSKAKVEDASGPWGEGSVGFDSEDFKSMAAQAAEKAIDEELHRLQMLAANIQGAISKYNHGSEDEQKNVPQWRKWLNACWKSIEIGEKVRQKLAVK